MQLTPHFQLDEFACRCGCGRHKKLSTVANLRRLAINLEVIREAAGGGPLVVQSGFRCPAHNARVGGATRSLHMQGLAADLRGRHITPARLAEVIERLIGEGKVSQGGIGIYSSSGFTHYDCRSVIGMRPWRDGE